MARLSIAIQGESKMHKTEVDLVPAACVLDELSRTDGQPSERVMPIAILGATELSQDADGVCTTRSPHWDVRAYVDHGIAGTTRASCAIVSPPTEAPLRFSQLSGDLARIVERGCRMPTHSRLISGSANSECLT
uniref:NodK n=1 Tax=Bradyrhizobium elkanii TaxID=29448 RepID=I6U5U7_BRAEL|nr:NodK [Bradyrhizobium elkanii]